MTQEQKHSGGEAAGRLINTPFYSYHDFTKHTVAKLMSYHHHLDWANQPDPFRTYAGASRIELPRSLTVSEMSYFAALEAMLVGQGVERSCDIPAPRNADLEFVSDLLFYSMAISAWKQVSGTHQRWSLRANPSSGNLHPTETHLLLHALADVDKGAYHYYVPGHALEQRSTSDLAPMIWEALTADNDTPPVVICLASIFWRESWKYRDRGYRYCQHDMGHALGAIILSAAILGWRAEILGEFPDQDMARWLALANTDEVPALIIGLRPFLRHGSGDSGRAPNAERWNQDAPLFSGKANLLSHEQAPYPSIDSVHQATCLSGSAWLERRGQSLDSCGRRPADMSPCAEQTAATYAPESAALDRKVSYIIRTRRSAIDLDGRQRMGLSTLSTLLVSATRGFAADFQRPTPWQPDQSDCGHHLIHLYLYIHRVDGLEPGIYYFDRVGNALVPLVHADERDAAKYASCFQDIAADGCFAVSMIADFNTAYKLYGDRGYRYVHFEAGCIGQWLYLGTTALGYESTGIGCFLDDVVNNLLGLPPGLECVYNFTVGRAVLDPRLTTLPAYDFPDPSLL